MSGLFLNCVCLPSGYRGHCLANIPVDTQAWIALALISVIQFYTFIQMSPVVPEAGTLYTQCILESLMEPGQSYPCKDK